ncbi:glutaredoxin family protein [Leucobacter sp. CSA1]|uniref:Glutaredoxin family protein n=1 Tax=Leucobacter chromiisoli TaxID=2796471 RepID=A0A934QAA7_9MICO|nr:glutaredoxin family protein [Leucobacter chromiisoli]MBK0419422.1 glutaredoxin family protein [Leucobacter chromiisoli]
MPTVSLTLIGRPGCHLCDAAREVVAAVRVEAEQRGIRTEVEELSILDDPALARRHSEDIPVVLVNGRRHAIWRVDAGKLSRALEKAAKRPLLQFRREG